LFARKPVLIERILLRRTQLGWHVAVIHGGPFLLAGFFEILKLLADECAALLTRFFSERR
jgi:hypothetical protein